MNFRTLETKLKYQLCMLLRSRRTATVEDVQTDYSDYCDKAGCKSESVYII